MNEKLDFNTTEKKPKEKLDFNTTEPELNSTFDPSTVQNRIDSMPSTPPPLQSELSLPEKVFQQHLKGQGYPDPKAKGILEGIANFGKKGIESPLQSQYGMSFETNPFTGQAMQFHQPASVEKIARVGDKFINYSGALQRVPATALMLAKNKREGKPNINNVSNKEALWNAATGDRTKEYGDTSLLTAGARTVKSEESWNELEDKYAQMPVLNKFFVDATAMMGDIVGGTLTAGKIMIPAMKYLSPSGKLSKVAMQSVDRAHQMILEDEELAKVRLDRIASVDLLKQRTDDAQKFKINIDTLNEVAGAIKVEKKNVAELKPSDLLYRGQKKDFPNMQTVEGSDIENNILLGKGVYTTTNEEVAKGYSKGTNEYGKVFKMLRPNPDEVFDLTNATDDQLKALGLTDDNIYGIRQAPKHGASIMDQENSIASLIVNANYPGGLNHKDVFVGGYIDQIVKYAKNNPTKTEKEISDKFWYANSSSLDTVKLALQEIKNPGSVPLYKKYLDAVNLSGNRGFATSTRIENTAKEIVTEKLKSLGYKWWKHNGGLRTGGVDHDVYVAISDDAIKLVKDKAELDKQLRAVNKTIKGAKPELFDDVMKLEKDIDSLQSEVLADHRLVKSALDDMVRSGIKATGSEQDALDEINRVYTELNKGISKSTKDVKSLQSVQPRIDNIKKMIALTDQMEEQIGNQFKRKLYTQGITGMVKRKVKDEYSGVIKESGFLGKKELERNALVVSHNRTSNWKELNGVEMESLYDTFKGLKEIDKDVGKVSRIQSWVSPEATTFEKLGARWLHTDVEESVFKFTNFTRVMDKTFNDFLDKFKSITKQKWAHGSAMDDLLSNMLENPDKLPAIYSDPEVAGMLNDTQKSLIKEAADLWRGLTNFMKDELLKEGMISEDIAGFNALKAKQTELSEQVKVMEAGKKLLTPKTEEYIVASAKISDVKKELKTLNRKIKDHPPLVVPNYYSHKGMLDKNILEDIERARNAKTTGWSSDGDLPNYSKNSFAGIAVNINSPELMKRLKDGTLYRRDAMAVMREALISESRKAYLQPIFEKGKAYIDALPEGSRKDLLHEAYDGMVRITRGMEHPIDKGLNKIGYDISKGIEGAVASKTVQRITGGKLHYVAQRRAYEHFTEGVRQLAFFKTLFGNVRNVTKNAFQMTLTIATIGERSTIAGVEGVFNPNGRWLLEQMPVYFSGVPIENFLEPKGMMGWTTKIGYIGQTVTEKYWNRAGAGLGGIYHAFTKSQKNMDDLMKFALTKGIDPKSIKGDNFWNVVRQYVEAGNGKDIMRGANDNIRVTQFDYAKYSTMPLLHSTTGRILLMFSNWPSHYFFSFLPHIWNQLIKGTSTLEVAGVHYKWTDTDRYGIFKYIAITAGTYFVGKNLGFDMDWQLPTQQLPSGNIAGTRVPVTISPPLSLLLDLGIMGHNYMLGKPEAADSALKRVVQDVYPNSIKNVQDISTGELPPQSLFIKTEESKVSYGGNTRPNRGHAVRPRR